MSEGVQGSSELPLCSGVLGNSPVLWVTAKGLGQTRSAFPQGWLLNPNLPRGQLATAQRRPRSLGQAPNCRAELSCLLTGTGHPYREHRDILDPLCSCFQVRSQAQSGSHSP